MWRVPSKRAVSPANDAGIARLSTFPDHDTPHPGNKLKAWMITHGITLSELGRMACINKRSLRDLINGVCHNRTHMTLTGAFSLEFVTNGHVQAWEWLNDPYLEARVRSHRVAIAREMENQFKRLILRGRGGGDAQGMLRNKARCLSRLFQVNWAEVKRRSWADARVTAAWEMADVSHLMLSVDGD